MLRQATIDDVCRIAEISVYNNRINYYPIFQDMEFSFKVVNVFDTAKYFSQSELLSNITVYEDEVLKGFICVKDGEIQKLYVDSFFQNEGIGQVLIDYAIKEKNATHLWVLEKNSGARRFYERNGFKYDGQKEYEEGTAEFLLHMTSTI